MILERFDQASQGSGVWEAAWDGLDERGQSVPPGTYVFDLTLSAEREEKRTGVLAVVY